MTTIKEQYMELAKQEENELLLKQSKILENYCQKIVDDLVKDIWKNEKYYLKKFKNLILDKKEAKYYVKIIPTNSILYETGFPRDYYYTVSIKNPDSFFGYYSFNIIDIIDKLKKFICEHKLPKEFILGVECYTQYKQYKEPYNELCIFITLL